MRTLTETVWMIQKRKRIKRSSMKEESICGLCVDIREKYELQWLQFESRWQKNSVCVCFYRYDRLNENSQKWHQHVRVEIDEWKFTPKKKKKKYSNHRLIKAVSHSRTTLSLMYNTRTVIESVKATTQLIQLHVRSNETKIIFKKQADT